MRTRVRVATYTYSCACARLYVHEILCDDLSECEEH